VLDVGGGDSRLVDYLLGRSIRCVTVLDISGAALARARERLGPRQTDVKWLEADVTGEWTTAPVDIWHDRAVFHFLTTAADRDRYRAQLLRTVRREGSVIIATFGPKGPTRCSGLPTVRYAPEDLEAELGGRFHLRETVREVHPTPFGTRQEFWYSRFTLT
jgi:ubiquinone/menaquinone biosynthesis C-methylase UbiE